MGNEMFVFVFITGIAHLLSAFRLACYQRDEERHSWRDGLLISLCGGLFCVAGIDVFLTSVPVSPWHAVVSVLFCVLIIRSDGNIIVLWRTLK